MWAIFSISAAFVWALVNTIDKYVLSKRVDKPMIIIVIGGFVMPISGLFVYLLHSLPNLSPLNILLALIAGTFYVLSGVFYLKSLKSEEMSRVIPLLSFSSLFVLLFATLFLNEIFTPLKYLGIFLLLVGAFLVSSKDFLKIKLGRAFWFMVLASLAGAINATLSKYLLKFTDFWTVFAYTRMGGILPLIPIAYFYFPELITATKRYGKKAVTLIVGNSILNILGLFLFTIAISLGPVTMVNALGAVQPFFVLLIAVILTIFYSEIIKEEIGKSTISLKLFGIILIFVGVILIT